MNQTPSPRIRTLDLCYCALFAGLIAVCAWISLPAGPISFTLQTFAVFAALVTLGGKRGSLAVLVYLLLGAVGLPVFAGFKGGPAALFGTTGGYILGFLAAALLYWLLTAKGGTRLPTVILACVAGMVACYAFGTLWFVRLYTAHTGPMTVQGALAACVYPFLPFDALKIALAIFLSRRLAPHLH